MTAAGGSAILGVLVFGELCRAFLCAVPALPVSLGHLFLGVRSRQCRERVALGLLLLARAASRSVAQCRQVFGTGCGSELEMLRAHKVTGGQPALFEQLSLRVFDASAFRDFLLFDRPGRRQCPLCRSALGAPLLERRGALPHSIFTQLV